MNIQAFVDNLSAEWRKERSATQMTLGELVEFLQLQDPNKCFAGFNSPHSYRGYYSDLALEPTGTQEKADELLKIALSALGETFTGYKGGEFLMGRDAPIWFAFYGDCGDKLISYEEDGAAITQKDE